MVLKAVAHKINDIYGLKENENLTNEQRIEKVEKIISELYTNGRKSGYNLGVYDLKKQVELITIELKN